MKSIINDVSCESGVYQALVFWCPGCERIDKDGDRQAGLHMLPIGGDFGSRPSWVFDGDLEAPTLSPSILTKMNWESKDFVCHSFLKKGVFQFLSDCTHQYKDQYVPIPDLPEWAENL